MISNFGKMMAGFTLSNLGSWFRTIAVIGLIYEYTHSAMAVGVSFLIRFLPRVLINFVSGAIVDQFSKKGMMVWANYAAFAIDIVLYLSIGHISLLYVYGLLFLIHAADALYNPARMAIIPDLFQEKGLYAKASAQLRMTREATMLISTGIGGLLIAWVGLKNIFLIDGVSYLLSGLFHQSMNVSLTLKKEQTKSVQSELAQLRKNIREGFHELKKHQVLKGIVGSFTIRNFTYGIANIAFTLIIYDKFKLGNSWLGWSYMAGGVGAILGGMYIQKYLRRNPLRNESALKVVNVANALNAVALLLMFISPSIWPFLVMVLVHDVAMVATEVILEASTITLAPNEVTGRISSLFLTFGEGGFFFGSLLYTFVLHALGATMIGVLVFVIMLVGVLIISTLYTSSPFSVKKGGKPC